MLFLYLFLAHLLSDFVFQPNALVVWKHKSWKGIFVHTLILFATSMAILWPTSFHVWVAAVLFGNAALHFVMDRYKIFHEKKDHTYVQLFFLDQAFHIVILGLVCALLWNTIIISPSIYGSFVVVYCIIAILLTNVLEILRYQFSREKSPHTAMKLDFRKMFMRLLVFTVIFGLIMVFGIYEFASTLVF